MTFYYCFMIFYWTIALSTFLLISYELKIMGFELREKWFNLLTCTILWPMYWSLYAWKNRGGER